jgi:hypothetical protein
LVGCGRQHVFRMTFGGCLQGVDGAFVVLSRGTTVGLQRRLPRSMGAKVTAPHVLNPGVVVGRVLARPPWAWGKGGRGYCCWPAAWGRTWVFHTPYSVGGLLRGLDWKCNCHCAAPPDTSLHTIIAHATSHWSRLAVSHVQPQASAAPGPFPETSWNV